LVGYAHHLHNQKRVTERRNAKPLDVVDRCGCDAGLTLPNEGRTLRDALALWLVLKTVKSFG
jgi:hypothetical protein